MAAAPASASVVVPYCTTTTTVAYAFDEADVTPIFTGYQIHDTAVFADESAEPTGKYAGATTTNSLNYAADLLRGHYVPATATFVNDEVGDAGVYAVEQAPPTLKYTLATADNGVYLTFETVGYTLPYLLQLPRCVISDVTYITRDIISPANLS